MPSTSSRSAYDFVYQSLLFPSSFHFVPLLNGHQPLAAPISAPIWLSTRSSTLYAFVWLPTYKSTSAVIIVYIHIYVFGVDVKMTVSARCYFYSIGVMYRANRLEWTVLDMPPAVVLCICYHFCQHRQLQLIIIIYFYCLCLCGCLMCRRAR